MKCLFPATAAVVIGVTADQAQKTSVVKKREAARAESPLRTALAGVLPQSDLSLGVTAVPLRFRRRTFTAGDQVVTFLRVYQGGNAPLAAVPMRVQLSKRS